jgi:Xaa-Pro aminopeptidase
VQPANVKGAEREMYGFETITLCPIDRRLVAVGLLTGEERAWFDAYHKRVLTALGSRVSKTARAWLKAACAPL